MNHTIQHEDAPDGVQRFSVVVDASPSDVFELLATPARHHEFDGSGTVRQATSSAPERLSHGAKFSMGMKMVVPYRMSNEVVEFVEDERIAWRHMGGHIWRYSLEETDGGTKVTEEFDARPSRIPIVLKVLKSSTTNARSIEQTLGRLAAVFES